MKVLVTGAFGTLGGSAVDAIAGRGHAVKTLDLPTRAARKTAARLGGKIEAVWGDVRNKGDVERAVRGADAVVHLAFVLPPRSERDPAFAETVNVGGTRNVLEATAAGERFVTIVFASTFCVHGITQDREPPLRAGDPLRPNTSYTRHKVEAERLIRESGLRWSILRFGVVLPARLGGKLEPCIFDIPAETRYECIHPADAGEAIVSCLEAKAARGRIFMIGGGKTCQVRYGDLINRSLEAVGLAPLPEKLFSPTPLHGGDWMDTDESQAILRYQSRSFDDYLRDMKARAGLLRPLLVLLRPLVRRWMAGKSPYR
jgi:UDP-glucose 4-epimerase